MKVVHIESGLGNQMLSYCEYLALKKINPNEDIYIENMIYDIPECNEVICQWNGYELERIFGVKAPNIRELFSDEQWNEIQNEIRESQFWKRNWNYPIWFVKAFNRAGLDLINIRGDFEEPSFVRKYSGKHTWKSKMADTKLGDVLKRNVKYLRKRKMLCSVDNKKNLFINDNRNIFTGQWLSFMHLGNNIEFIDSDIRQVFQFPVFCSKKNKDMSEFLQACNSVAVHARRGDMLGYNSSCYKYGYFKRAVQYIKKNVENPVFVFFCEPGSIEWCKENGDIFALDFSKDQVYFVNWNSGEESFRDLQLMTYCKHAIITNSSFGWWGAYLINNPDKITISPDITYNTTYHC